MPSTAIRQPMTTSTINDIHPGAPPVVRVVGMARRRILAAIVAFGAMALLGIAMWVTPASAGLGTHEQLNLPQCGWITTMDVPCPTCGMTTAFSHTVRGQFVAAFLAQPMGFLLAIATAMTVLISGYILMTGSPIGERIGRLWSGRTAWWLGGAVALAWVYKVTLYKGVFV